MKLWKCMRALDVIFGGKVSKKRSISIVLPLPTSPYIYSPFGRLARISLIEFLPLLLVKRELKTDFNGG